MIYTRDSPYNLRSSPKGQDNRNTFHLLLPPSLLWDPSTSQQTAPMADFISLQSLLLLVLQESAVQGLRHSVMPLKEPG
jgi:hypothetical protein